MTLFKQHFFFLITLSLLVLLTACGSKGDLYLVAPPQLEQEVVEKNREQKTDDNQVITATKPKKQQQ